MPHLTSELTFLYITHRDEEEFDRRRVAVFFASASRFASTASFVADTLFCSKLQEGIDHGAL
jgi:hypothetical protein